LAGDGGRQNGIPGALPNEKTPREAGPSGYKSQGNGRHLARLNGILAGQWMRDHLTLAPLKALMFLNEFGQGRFVQFVQNAAELLMVAGSRSE
jgi:hypothetical protein